jgi:hypothetical protein
MSIIALKKTNSVLKGKTLMQDCAEKWSGPDHGPTSWSAGAILATCIMHAANRLMFAIIAAWA